MRVYIGGMKILVRVSLANEQGEEFCGSGVLELLAGIGERGSIRQSALAMGLSYVKALRILSRVERELGRPLVRSSKGGAERGRSVLLPAAERLMADWGVLRAEIDRAAAAAFKPFRARHGLRRKRRVMKESGKVKQ